MTQAPRRSWLWLQGLACGALACLATPTALLLGGLLAPGLVMWVMEKETGKPNARAMLLCGAAVSFAPLGELWSRGHLIATSLDLLGGPGALASAWAGACAGWLLREGTWLVTKLASEAATLRNLAALKSERAALEAERGAMPGRLEPGRALSA